MEIVHRNERNLLLCLWCFGRSLIFVNHLNQLKSKSLTDAHLKLPKGYLRRHLRGLEAEDRNDDSDYRDVSNGVAHSVLCGQQCEERGEATV